MFDAEPILEESIQFAKGNLPVAKDEHKENITQNGIVNSQQIAEHTIKPVARAKRGRKRKRSLEDEVTAASQKEASTSDSSTSKRKGRKRSKAH